MTVPMWWDVDAYGAHVPGMKPGVYEVDPIIPDVGHTIWRYSYHNGRDWGPVAHSIEEAFKYRFCGRLTEVTCFCGLVEEAQ